MKKWMNQHVCNEICKVIPMDEDPILVQKCVNYLKRFKGEGDNFDDQLKVILSGL